MPYSSCSYFLFFVGQILIGDKGKFLQKRGAGSDRKPGSSILSLIIVQIPGMLKGSSRAHGGASAA